jgi:hypothetical protein
MEFLITRDTTRIAPARQDTSIQADTIPVAVKKISLADLDSVMKRIEVREETIRVQQAKPAIKSTTPFQKVFHYAHLLEKDFEPISEKTLFPVPKEKFTMPEIAPVPVLKNDNYRETFTTGRDYKAYLNSHNTGQFLRTGTLLFQDWVIYAVLFSFLGIFLLKMAYTRFLQPVLAAVASHKETINLYNNRNSITQNTFLVMHFLFAVNAGLFLYLTGYFFDILPDIGHFYTFLLLIAGVFLIYQIKFLILFMLGFFFDQLKAFTEYIHTISLYNKFLGILLLPILAGMVLMNEQFTGIFIYAGIVLIVLAYIIRVIRGAGIILEKGFSVFYMFLYLCALEILPLLVVYKLLEL